jgi:hypothetical protein
MLDIMVIFNTMESEIITFEFESLKLISDWNYNSINNICFICNTSIYEEEPIKNKFKNKFKNIIITDIVKGECSHAFHRNCIKKYLKKNSSCPSCPEKTEYKFKQHLDNISSIKLFSN